MARFGASRLKRLALPAVAVGVVALLLLRGRVPRLPLPLPSLAAPADVPPPDEVDSAQFVLPPPSQWPDVELWASGTAFASPPMAAALRAELGPDYMKLVEELCGRCLFHTLLEGRTQVFGTGQSVFVATGDILDEWLRDGAVQIGVFLPRVRAIPGLRNLVDTAIRTQAYLLALDPWANSFSQKWKTESDLTQGDMELGRYGFVSTRNYEPDTGAYFINLLYNYFRTEPAIWGRERFLNETVIHDAVLTTLRTYRIEQEHEKESPYLYKELPYGGKGSKVGYTGMVWGGFRPSDDAQAHGYNVPVNMYVCAALEKAVLLNAAVWRDPEIEKLAGEMAEQIREGIETYGKVKTSDTQEYIYAYEVDGLGSSMVDFDDPNVPSLLSVPILGYRHYDETAYLRTKQRLLSDKNKYYFETEFSAARNNYRGKKKKIPFFGGTGSPHTPPGHIWPLGTMVEAILDRDVYSRADAFRLLLEMQCGNGLMHESVSVNDVTKCTRPVFEWANTMFVVLFESSFGKSCEGAFEKQRREAIGERAAKMGGIREGGFYGTMMSRVKHWSGLELFDRQGPHLRDVAAREVGTRWKEFEGRLDRFSAELGEKERKAVEEAAEKAARAVREEHRKAAEAAAAAAPPPAPPPPPPPPPGPAEGQKPDQPAPQGDQQAPGPKEGEGKPPRKKPRRKPGGGAPPEAEKPGPGPQEGKAPDGAAPQEGKAPDGGPPSPEGKAPEPPAPPADKPEEGPKDAKPEEGPPPEDEGVPPPEPADEPAEKPPE
ncbi:Six-hairpin glycosidase-like protein [Hyaloraphidium curvatum]|nr:Six-hairpin glycosidase-like protein [Hyaloraphidium curvatum]